jgi:hypothetical protein
MIVGPIRQAAYRGPEYSLVKGKELAERSASRVKWKADQEARIAAETARHQRETLIADEKKRQARHRNRSYAFAQQVSQAIHKSVALPTPSRYLRSEVERLGGVLEWHQWWVSNNPGRRERSAQPEGTARHYQPGAAKGD